MEEDTMHVLVPVRMPMAVVMSMMCVSVLKRHDTDQVDEKASKTDH